MEKMEPLRQTQKKYGSSALITAVIISVVFILAGQKTVAKGFLLGAVFSVMNFILIAETLPFRLHPSRAKSFLLSLLSILLRYALMAVPLIVAIKFEQFNVFATMVGIFIIQMIILGDHLLKIMGLKREQQAHDNL
jgi:hypothetical protein